MVFLCTRPSRRPRSPRCPESTGLTTIGRGVRRTISIPTLPLTGLLLAMCAGALAASRRFDGLYGQDAYAYFDYSTASVRDSILHFKPLEAFFWPPGYPVLVALTSLVTGPIPLAGQLVSLLMGALVPVLTGLLVVQLFPGDRPLALLSALTVAVCGQLWQSSVVVMADTTGLALATLSAVALVRYTRTCHGVWLLAASAALAYATLARWIYGIVALPFAAYALWYLLRRHQVSDLLWTAAAVLVGLVILAPIVGPPLVGLLSHPGEPAAFAGNFQVYSWSPLNALRHDFFTADGHLEYTLPNGVYYAIAPANLAFFGPLLAPWIVAGLWAARRWPGPTVLLIVGWAICVYAFHAGAAWQNFRFTLAYLPPVAILASAGLLLAWRHHNRVLRVLALACASAGLLLAAASAVRLVERFVDTKDNELTLVRWVQSETPDSTQLFTFGPTLAFRHYSSLPTFDLFDLTPADIHDILSTSAPHYLLVDVASVEDQWLDQAPSTNFHLLRDAPGLTEIGSNEGYTLYQVNQSSP
jgi:Dolichyl-phosphate-mannose-protein mannosyltransferase